jgi:hypothetical protein
VSTPDYLTSVELRAVLRDDGSDPDADSTLLARAATAASRWVDRHCGRFFYLTTTPTIRYLRPAAAGLLLPGDGAGTPTVETTTDDGASWDTWAATDFVCEPTARFDAEPWTRIRAVGDLRFPMTLTQGARVTATWGWPAIPAPVVQATQIAAVVFYRSRDLTGTTTGFDESNPAGTDLLNLAVALLADYRHPNLPAPAAAG